jgi:Protein of unknown function, DUF488
MKIYTASWFTDLPPTIRRIGISRGTRGVLAGYRVLQELQPGPWFHSVSPAEYVERYFSEILQPLDLQAVLRRIETLAEGRETAALLCYERPPFSIGADNWCHRRMAASALERELGVEIPEYLAPGQSVGDAVPIGAGIKEWRELMRASAP